MPTQADIMRFDAFELDLSNRRLIRNGQPVDLGSRYFDALVLLVREAGELVSKDRFMDEVWRGIPVTDEALTQCIRTLRRALGDDAGNPHYIQTVPKHGYRFLVQPTGPGEGSVTGDSYRLPGRIAAAGTLSGAMAGAAGGLFYGVVASTGGGSTVVVLAALVAALGTLGGAGVGLGMASILAWRERIDVTLVFGAMLGGLAVGALGSTLGRDGIGLLTGEDIRHVTGMIEGLLLGCATGLAGWLVLSGSLKSRAAIAGASIGLGALAGALVHLVGGRLLGGSLVTLQESLGDTRLSLARAASVFGEARFGETAHLVACVTEGAVFVSFVALALTLVRKD